MIGFLDLNHFAAKFCAIELGTNLTRRGWPRTPTFMAPRRRRLSRTAKSEQQIDVLLNVAHAVRAPGPQLRTDVVDNGNATAMEPARQSQIEFRPIDQNRGWRFSSFSGPFQLPNARQNFGNARPTSHRPIIANSSAFTID